MDRALAYGRHFPSINWLTSYSEYISDLKPWYDQNVSPKFMTDRQRIFTILQEEDQLLEIVKLIGADVLPEDQKLTLDTARLIRVGFLQQNAYNAIDTYVPLEKQFQMMEVILTLFDGAKQLLERSIPLSQIRATGIFDTLSKIKYEVPNDNLERFEGYRQQICDALKQVDEANR